MCLGKQLLLISEADAQNSCWNVSGAGYFSLHRGNFHLPTAQSPVAAHGELTQPPVPACCHFIPDNNAPTQGVNTEEKNAFTLLLGFISSGDLSLERPRISLVQGTAASRVPEDFP